MTQKKTLGEEQIQAPSIWKPKGKGNKKTDTLEGKDKVLLASRNAGTKVVGEKIIHVSPIAKVIEESEIEFDVLSNNKVDDWTPLEPVTDHNQILDEINLDPEDHRELNFSQAENTLREAALGPVHNWAGKLPQQLDEGVRIEIDSEEEIEEDLHAITLNISQELKLIRGLNFRNHVLLTSPLS